MESDSGELFHIIPEHLASTPFVEDGVSPTALLRAFYLSNSGAAGTPHNWARFRNLFSPIAQLVACLSDPDGQHQSRVSSVDEYIALATPNLEQRGFQEREIGQRTVRYGTIAHVWSAYEAQHGSGTEALIIRGINSFQLAYSDERWWIVNLIWTNERSAGPLPDSYRNLHDPEPHA